MTLTNANTPTGGQNPHQHLTHRAATAACTLPEHRASKSEAAEPDDCTWRLLTGAGCDPSTRPAAPAPRRRAALTAEETRVVDRPREEAGVAHAEHVPAVEAHILLPLLEPAAVHQVPATHGSAARRGPSEAARADPLPQAPPPPGEGGGGEGRSAPLTKNPPA